MFGLGLPEIIIIFLVIGILFFGGQKMSELSKTMGRLGGEFKKGKKEISEELEKMDMKEDK